MGLPWHRDTQFNFVRRHQKAPDCSNINELFHLGGRYYLSTQHGSINVYNTTNGSSRILHISPLIVYHFPCALTFASQQTGMAGFSTSLLELISLTLVCGLVDPSLFASLLKLLQWGLASIYQGKLESPLIKVSLRMTFLSRQSSCVVIVPSQLANHA